MEIVKYGNVLNVMPMPKLYAKEMDIFMQVISKMQFTDKQELVFDGFEFFKELKKLPQNKEQSYEYLFEAFSEFAGKILGFKIEYYDEPTDTQYAFVCFDSLKFDYSTSKVHIHAQKDFYNIIKNYKLGFTSFELLEFADLSSTYTKILYRLLKQFRKTGLCVISIEKFRELMQVPDSYDMCDIDARVLKQAIKELSAERNLLNQKRTPFKDLKCEKIKGGGRGRGGIVKKLKFTFKKEATIDLLNKAYKGLILNTAKYALVKIIEISGDEPNIEVKFLLLDDNKISKCDANGEDAIITLTFESFERLERAIAYYKNKS